MSVTHLQEKEEEAETTQDVGERRKANGQAKWQAIGQANGQAISLCCAPTSAISQYGHTIASSSWSQNISRYINT